MDWLRVDWEEIRRYALVLALVLGVLRFVAGLLRNIDEKGYL